MRKIWLEFVSIGPNLNLDKFSIASLKKTAWKIRRLIIDEENKWRIV
jgi:hypothetical protein